MNRNKRYIICSWIMLICFIAGQCMVFAHQHKILSKATTVGITHQTKTQALLKEKCELCDAMHHNVMAAESSSYTVVLTPVNYYYHAETYRFVSISLILSAGRSPPIS